MDLAESVQIASPAFKFDPFPFHARMRAGKPVCRVNLPTKQEAWLVARYDDVARLLKDPRLVKDPANAMKPEQLASQPNPPRMFAPLTRNMLGLDDPDHARLKRLVQAGFTPRRIEGLIGRTEAIAERLLDGLDRKPQFDLVSDFAMPLPITGHLGTAGRAGKDRARFARCSHTLLSTPLGSWRVVFSLPDLILFMRYLRKLAELKRREPGDDLVSALVAIEADGDKLGGDELLAMIAILLSAGHETTTNLIANGTAALLQHPHAFEQLRAKPELMGTAIEECCASRGRWLIPPFATRVKTWRSPERVSPKVPSCSA